jgi:hypothetical protein
MPRTRSRTQAVAALAVVAAVLALVPPAAAAAASPGSTIHVRLAGPSQDPDAPDRLQAGATLEVAADVEAADGTDRSGHADVTLEAYRPLGTRSYSFQDVAWSGSAETVQGELASVTVKIPWTQAGGDFVAVTVDAEGDASRAGALAATGSWWFGDVQCTSDSEEPFDEHGDKDHCVGFTEETGDGVGSATVEG